ncbi:MAG TPA: type II toxin-antitoxin system HicB family antitoxin [Thermoanaerobaculia bacterium]|jgi:predicted RNase H-like HicB family nuclease|nr:type II toxin-antitoxin system HicB family antitoxin [Thermoanaerobaculia bacterium]
MNFTTTISAEGDGYVALCRQLDIASQGDSAEQASANLSEAVELFIEAADTSEVERRLRRR